MDAALDALAACDFRRAARLAEGAARAAPAHVRPALHLVRAFALLQVGGPSARAQLAAVLESPGAAQAIPPGFSGMLSDCVWNLGAQEAAAQALFLDAAVRAPKPTQAQLFPDANLQYLLGTGQFSRADLVLQQYGRYAANCNALTEVEKDRENLASIVGRACLAISAAGEKGVGGAAGAGAAGAGGAREEAGAGDATADPAGPAGPAGAASDSPANSPASPSAPVPKKKLVATGAKILDLALKICVPRLLKAVAEGQEVLGAKDAPKGEKEAEGGDKDAGKGGSAPEAAGGAAPPAKELPFKSKPNPRMRNGLLHRQHLGALLSGLVEFDATLSAITGTSSAPMRPLYARIRAPLAASAGAGAGAPEPAAEEHPAEAYPGEPGDGVETLASTMRTLSPRIYHFVRSAEWPPERQVRLWTRLFASTGTADLLAVAQAICGQEGQPDAFEASRAAFREELERLCAIAWGEALSAAPAGPAAPEGGNLGGKWAEAVSRALAPPAESDPELPPPLERGAALTLDQRLSLFFVLSSLPELALDQESVMSAYYSAALRDLVRSLGEAHRLRELLALDSQCQGSFARLAPAVSAALEEGGQGLYALYFRTIAFFEECAGAAENGASGPSNQSGSSEARAPCVSRAEELLHALSPFLAAEPEGDADAEYQRLEALLGCVLTLGCLAVREEALRARIGTELAASAQAILDALSKAKKDAFADYPFSHLIRPLLSSLLAALPGGADVYVSDPEFATVDAFDVSCMLFETYAPLLLPALLQEGSIVSPAAALAQPQPEAKPAPPKGGPAAQKGLAKVMKAALKRFSKKSGEAQPSRELASLRYPQRYANFRSHLTHPNYVDMGAAGLVSGITSNYVSSLQASGMSCGEAVSQVISPVQYFDGLWFRERFERSAYTRLCVALEGAYMVLSGWAFHEFSQDQRDLRGELLCCLAVVGQLRPVGQAELLNNIDSSLFSPVAHLLPARPGPNTVVGNAASALLKVVPGADGEIARPREFAVLTRLVFGDTGSMQYCIPADAFASAQVVEVMRLLEARLRTGAVPAAQLQRVREMARPEAGERPGVSVLPSSGLLTETQARLLLAVAGAEGAEGIQVSEADRAALQGLQGLGLTIFAPLLLAALSVALATGAPEARAACKELAAAAAEGCAGEGPTRALLSGAFRALSSRAEK